MNVTFNYAMDDLSSWQELAKADPHRQARWPDTAIFEAGAPGRPDMRFS